jgi:hypothetical protein
MKTAHFLIILSIILATSLMIPLSYAEEDDYGNMPDGLSEALRKEFPLMTFDAETIPQVIKKYDLTRDTLRLIGQDMVAADLAKRLGDFMTDVHTMYEIRKTTNPQTYNAAYAEYLKKLQPSLLQDQRNALFVKLLEMTDRKNEMLLEVVDDTYTVDVENRYKKLETLIGSVEILSDEITKIDNKIIELDREINPPLDTPSNQKDSIKIEIEKEREKLDDELEKTLEERLDEINQNLEDQMNIDPPAIEEVKIEVEFDWPNVEWAPLIFKTDPRDIITAEPRYPDQCKLWNTDISTNKVKLWHFTIQPGTDPVCMNFQLQGGYVLFLDFNDNDKIDNCFELLCAYGRLNDDGSRKTVYDVLMDFPFNSKYDDMFDSEDILFKHAKAWKPATVGLVMQDTDYFEEGTQSIASEIVPESVLTMKELGITGFKLVDYIPIGDDHTGTGMYTDCDYSEDDYRYQQWVEDGGVCVQYSLDHLRGIALHPHGVEFEDGTIMPTMDFVIGWWDNETVENTHIAKYDLDC